MSQEIKKRLLEYCEQYVQQRIHTSQIALTEARDSAAGETKSSAGDKYETGRAMAQLEMEQNNEKLQDALKQQNQLQQISIDATTSSVQRGSFVETTLGRYFIAISIGIVQLEKNLTVAIVSPESPIGKLLIGRKTGDKISFNQKESTILGIH